MRSLASPSRRRGANSHHRRPLWLLFVMRLVQCCILLGSGVGRAVESNVVSLELHDATHAPSPRCQRWTKSALPIIVLREPEPQRTKLCSQRGAMSMPSYLRAFAHHWLPVRYQMAFQARWRRGCTRTVVAFRSSVTSSRGRDKLLLPPSIIGVVALQPFLRAKLR